MFLLPPHHYQTVKVSLLKVTVAVSKYCSTVYVSNNYVSVQEHVENVIYTY